MNNRLKLKMSQAVGLKELVATLVVAGVLLIVGTVVFAKVKAALGSDYVFNETVNATNTDANTAIRNIETTTYDSFELATVALIVLAAAVIIGILINAFSA